ncbi:predicted protein [Streptomyces sp. AA4]|nr:predicted protein [Streptomyces sp. AA4]
MPEPPPGEPAAPRGGARPGPERGGKRGGVKQRPGPGDPSGSGPLRIRLPRPTGSSRGTG